MEIHFKKNMLVHDLVYLARKLILKPNDFKVMLHLQELMMTAVVHRGYVLFQLAHFTVVAIFKQFKYLINVAGEKEVGESSRDGGSRRA